LFWRIAVLRHGKKRGKLREIHAKRVILAFPATPRYAPKKGKSDTTIGSHGAEEKSLVVAAEFGTVPGRNLEKPNITFTTFYDETDRKN
jgi:hypothetical protein